MRNRNLESKKLPGLLKDKNYNWNDGKYVNGVGYHFEHNPNHHRANQIGYVRTHILLAEKALGKPLPDGTQVHHWGDIGDNSKIVLCQDQMYHFLLHIRARSLRECGNANYRRCKFCQEYDDPKNLFIKHYISTGRGWQVYHHACSAEYDRKRYARNPKRLVKRREYYAKNSERILRLKRERYAAKRMAK